MWRAQGNKELKLLAAAHSVLAASIKGKGLNKRGAETLEKLNKFQKKTADDAPGRGGDTEPASGTARSASSTPTKKQTEPGSQVRRRPAGSLVAIVQQATISSPVQVDMTCAVK